jgi:dTDP-4-dehydrorhamnose reductase
MIKDKKFLITGAGGQLARAFISSLEAQGLEYLAPRKDQLDITDAGQVMAVVGRYRPDVLINCAAYNQVDIAQEHPGAAFSVNSDAVGNLAAACKHLNIFLVHFSSDYIFDGEKGELYTEEDAPNPLSVYGKSKLKGEEAVREGLNDFLIFRLSWVFGEGQNNFLYKLTQWARDKKSIQVVDDEISVPTFTEDVVKVVLLALERGLKGTYHLTNSGQCSRHEWAKYYFEKKGAAIEVCPVSSDRFPVKARRPRNSPMSSKKICDELNISIPSWQDAVDRAIKHEKREDNVTT